MTVKQIALSLITDRAVQFGTGGSSVGILGAITVSDVQQAAATFAAAMAGFASLVTAIYVCIKIARLLRSPDKAE